MAGRLHGRVAFVATDGTRADGLARALAADGATVVLLAAEPAAAGRLAATLGDGVAVYCLGDDPTADAAALAELAADLVSRPPS